MHETLPKLDRMCTNCIQEETWLVSMDDMDGMAKSSIEVNWALADCKRKGKKSSLGRRGSPRRRDSP
jgi:hypothetical protein